MPTCDIFCRVIDNLGDAGIAVRLARALSDQHGFHVRLYIDDPAPLQKLVPEGLSAQVQVVILPLKGGGAALMGDGGGDHTPIATIAPSACLEAGTSPFQGEDYFGAPPRTGPFQGEVPPLVIELLGADVPDDYIAAMQTRPGGPPLWIRYDYLSAENWVHDAHLKSSPHPKSGLARTFFYPGLTDQTGGILFSDTLEVVPPGSSNLPARLFMFSYDQPAVRDLADLWVGGNVPVALDLSAGAYLAHRPRSYGNLTVRDVPFLPQIDFDRVIGTYDLAFIRGEDSFSQGVAAGVPIIWQIYPTDDQAHVVKLQAFCDRFTDGLGVGAARAFTDMQMIWNGHFVRHPREGGDPAIIKEVWVHFTAHFSEISARARSFGAEIRGRGSAAQNLVDFYRKSR